MTIAIAAAGTSVPSKGYRIDVYPPHDRDVLQRDKWSRRVSLVCIIIIATLVPVTLGAYWGSFIGPFFTKVGLIAGIVGAIVMLRWLLPSLLISNPEWTGYVTLDPFLGENVAYGPGWHPCFPWEERNADGNYPLEVITKTFEVSVQTKTAKVTVKGVFEYQVDLTNITTFIGVAESTIDEGFTAFIETFLVEELAGYTAQEALAKVRTLNEILENEFMGVVTDTGDTVTEFERENGIRAVSLVVIKVELPESVQKSRDAIDEAAVLFEAVAVLLGYTPTELKAKLADHTVTQEQFQQARREALALAQKATMEFKRVDGDIGPAIADALIGGRRK